MQEFQRTIRAELGLPDKVIRQATAVLIRHLAHHADRRDVRALCDALPGLAPILVAAEKRGAHGHRTPDILPVDPSVGLRPNLEAAGLPPDAIEPFLDRALEVLRASAGSTLLDRRVRATPGLEELVSHGH